MSQNKIISFSQIKLILKKPAAERTPADIKDLRDYFKENKFFMEKGKENGEQW